MSGQQPPVWPTRFLRWFCDESLIDAIEGDLYEQYNAQLEYQPAWKVRFHYCLAVLTFLQPFAIKKKVNTQNSNSLVMFGHYLRLSFRKLQTFSAFSLINLTGLSIGLAAALLIGLQAWEMLSYNRIHEQGDQIYMAYKERITPAGTQATYDTWMPLAARLQAEYPQVQYAAPLYTGNARVIKADQYLPIEVGYTTAALFDIFSFDFIRKSGTEPFALTNSVVISASAAQRYFASDNPVGQTLDLHLNEDDSVVSFQVAAVFEDFPGNSSLQEDFYIPMQASAGLMEYQNSWGGSFMTTWLMLREGAGPADLEALFPDLIRTLWDDKVRDNTRFKLLSLHDVYDTLVGDISNAYILLAIAIGILLIAGINYMNLATAAYAERIKEISVRKVMGADRSSIASQYFAESLLYALLSAIIGVALAWLSAPYLNDWLGLQLSLAGLITWQGLVVLLAGILFFALFSGSYPAIYLSRIRQLHLGRYKSVRDAWVRNSLLLTQLVFAVGLINAALLIHGQINYMSGQDMGFDEEQLLAINVSPSRFKDAESGAAAIKLYKEQVAQYTFVTQAAASRHMPTRWSRSFTFVRPSYWEGDPLRMRYTFVDDAFFEVYDIAFAQGTNFMSSGVGEAVPNVILNEAAYQAFNFADTVTQPMINIGRTTYRVLGVVRDFHYESLRNAVSPTLHFYRPADHDRHNYLTIKLGGGSLATTLDLLQRDWDQLGAIQPFEVHFLDEAVQQLYESEQQFLGLIYLFMLVSLLIAAMGIFGMTLFLVNRKQKELSIRKVVGASLTQIVLLIYREYLAWVLAAAVLGTAAAVYFYRQWVTDFHYQAPISVPVLLLSIVAVTLVMALTAGYHAVRAGRDNPVNYLRSE